MEFQNKSRNLYGTTALMSLYATSALEHFMRVHADVSASFVRVLEGGGMVWRTALIINAKQTQHVNAKLGRSSAAVLSSGYGRGVPSVSHPVRIMDERTLLNTLFTLNKSKIMNLFGVRLHVLGCT